MHMCVQGRVIEHVQCGLMGFSFAIREIPESLRVVSYDNLWGLTYGVLECIVSMPRPLQILRTQGTRP
jgi:hypothetical protein